MYLIKGKMLVQNVDDKGAEYWKDKWAVDSVLRSGDMYYFCNKIIDAEFSDS